MLTIAEEFRFVGERKKLPWFTGELVDNDALTHIIRTVKYLKPEMSLRTVLYALFPITEYYAHDEGVALDRKDKQQWLDFIGLHRSALARCIAQYGVQGNIPQRAAIVLDYFTQSNLLKNDTATVIELGCSAGLLGTALCRSEELFGGDVRSLKNHFWLQRVPSMRRYHIDYFGFDQCIPPLDLVPYFVWDKDMREKITSFILTYEQSGEVRRKDAYAVLGDFSVCNDTSVVILTSFFLYQFLHPEKMVKKLRRIVQTNDTVHWLDLSRNRELPCVFGKGNALLPDHVYLSHNGTPVAHVINGSDDCPDWEYL